MLDSSSVSPRLASRSPGTDDAESPARPHHGRMESVPVLGAGVALDEGTSTRDTVLGFSILLARAVCASGWGADPQAQPRRRPRKARPWPTGSATMEH